MQHILHEAPLRRRAALLRHRRPALPGPLQRCGGQVARQQLGKGLGSRGVYRSRGAHAAEAGADGARHGRREGQVAHLGRQRAQVRQHDAVVDAAEARSRQRAGVREQRLGQQRRVRHVERQTHGQLLSRHVQVARRASPLLPSPQRVCDQLLRDEPLDGHPARVVALRRLAGQRAQARPRRKRRDGSRQAARREPGRDCRHVRKQRRVVGRAPRRQVRAEGRVHARAAQRCGFP